MGVLSSVGVEQLLVHPFPTVGVLSTGDELITSGGDLEPGKIRDANRPALLAQLQADGFGTVDLGVAGDEEVALTALLEEAGSRCDAIVSSGGVSVGDRDVMKTVLKDLSGPTMRSMQVAIKPAKPFAFGVLKETGTPVFALAGNPVSALVSYELFVRPALRSMAGCAVLDRPRLAAVADVDLPRPRDGKLHLMRVTVRSGMDGVLGVRLAGGQDSHMLRVMAQSNALALLPDGEGVRAGEPRGDPPARRERSAGFTARAVVNEDVRRDSTSGTRYCCAAASIPLRPSMLVTFFSAQYWRTPSLPFRADHWSMVGR